MYPALFLGLLGPALAAPQGPADTILDFEKPGSPKTNDIPTVCSTSAHISSSRQLEASLGLLRVFGNVSLVLVLFLRLAS